MPWTDRLSARAARTAFDHLLEASRPATSFMPTVRRYASIAIVLTDTWWSIRRTGAIRAVEAWAARAATVEKYTPQALDRGMIAGLRKLRALQRDVDDVLARLRMDNTCLYRSAVLYRAAVRERWANDVRLAIGAMRNDGGYLDSHAWLIVNGTPLFEGGREGGYVPITTLPRPARRVD